MSIELELDRYPSPYADFWLYFYFPFGIFKQVFLKRFNISAINPDFSFDVFVVFFIYGLYTVFIQKIPYDRYEIEWIPEFHRFYDFAFDDLGVLYRLFCGFSVGVDQSSDAE